MDSAGRSLFNIERLSEGTALPARPGLNTKEAATRLRGLGGGSREEPGAASHLCGLSLRAPRGCGTDGKGQGPSANIWRAFPMPGGFGHKVIIFWKGPSNP